MRVYKTSGDSLLDNGKTKVRLNLICKPVIEKAELTPEKVIAENVKIAFFDIRTMFDASGNIKPVQDRNDNIGTFVSSIEVFEEYEGNIKDRDSIGQTKKVKFLDKGATLDKFMKHLSIYAEYSKLQTV